MFSACGTVWWLRLPNTFIGDLLVGLNCIMFIVECLANAFCLFKNLFALCAGRVWAQGGPRGNDRRAQDRSQLVVNKMSVYS